jgi:hypothetical protein
MNRNKKKLLNSLYRKEEAKSGDKQVALKLLPTNKKTKQICS